MKSSAARKSQAGVGMIEVLVAVLILSIGVLGFAGMQLKALQGTGESFARSQATILADDLLSRVAVNPGQLAEYVKNWPTTADTSSTQPTWWNDCSSTATYSGGNLGSVTNKFCAQDAQAQNDVKQLAWSTAHLLPNGTMGFAQCTGADTYCVTVAWDDTTVANCDVGGDTHNKCIRLQVVP